MVRNELLMQFQSDILGCTVVRPAITETTVLGAAYAAGLAVGFYPDLDDLRRNWRAKKSWKPGMPAERREELYRQWGRAVERSFGWAG
jgi:glycerol kinase